MPDDPQYEAFYGLNEQPFAISTDPKFLFLSASHQRAYQELLTGLQRHEGLMLLTGEAGTGKTTLCRGVIDALGERTFSAILLNPYMSGAELLKVVLKEFGLVTREELRRGALARAEPPQLLDAIEGFLLSVRSIDSRAVVVVDEAQSLSPPVLDQVRLLTALERQGKPLLQIIIGGQPKLIDTLKKDVMYALSERITRRVHLAPLLADEVQAYITHRLTVAGGADGVEFLPEATTVVAELSRGLPRRVNLLCDRALQEGRVDETRRITPDMVRRAARSLAGVQPKTDAPSDSIADGVPEINAATARVAAPPPDIPGSAAAADDDEPVRAGSTLFDAPTPAALPVPAASGASSGARSAAQSERDDRAASEAAAEELIRRFKEAGSTSEPDTERDVEPAVMFGQGVPERRRRRWWLMVVAALVVAVGMAYGYLVMTLVEGSGAAPPAAPAAPAIAPDAPDWPDPLPVPDEAAVAEGLEQLRLLRLLRLGGGGGEP
jgi:general secretion pathway protein A